jgi:hypothetical protein
MVRTTPPKEDKAGTSSAESPMAQAMVARLGSKVLNGNLADDDPNLLNFDATGSEIVCRMSSRLQRCWADSGKSNYPIWYFRWSSFCAPDADPAFLVLDHEDVEGGLWAPLQLAPLVLLPLAILRTFRLDHPQWLFFSYDDLFTLGRLGLRWPNQDLLPIELDHVYVCRE